MVQAHAALRARPGRLPPPSAAGHCLHGNGKFELQSFPSRLCEVIKLPAFEGAPGSRHDCALGHRVIILTDAHGPILTGGGGASRGLLGLSDTTSTASGDVLLTGVMRHPDC